MSATLAVGGWACAVCGGPYTEAGVNGYVDPNNHWRHAGPEDSGAVVNPIFQGWATGVASYNQTPGVDPCWCDPSKVLGPATGRGDEDIFSLGDLSKEQIAEGVSPGQMTLLFGEAICNGKGYEFAVFENGFTTVSAPLGEQMFAELAYVEVSSNGEDFARFPAVSLTPGSPGMFGTIDISNVYNLAGKHPNSRRKCTGTPFDLQEIADDPKVISGLVDINDVRYVRVVDIPGTGDFHDEAGAHIDPGTWPAWSHYATSHPIFDPWNTSLVPLFPSGGFDLEAVGVLNEQEYAADIDLNGMVDMFDFTLFASAWGRRFGQSEWIGRCDLADGGDLIVDGSDLAAFAGQWLRVEKWRVGN